MHAFLRVAILFLSVLTFLPYLKIDNWAVRIWDYPRKQLLIAQLLCTLLLLLPGGITDPLHLVVFFTGVISLICLFYKAMPYTFLYHKQLKKAKSPHPDNQISIYISNVYMPNNKYALLLKSIKRKNPDFIMLVETDEKWKESLQSLRNEYTHCFFLPKDNTYGMLIFSKLELEDCNFKFLVEDEVPSFHAVIKLKSGMKFRFYGLHPKPPVPTESWNSTDRDAELLVVAKEISQLRSPAMVAGDLNDVAWSYTTKLFQRISGLLDPRIGRGFYSTFHARFFWARWPLDHIFVSAHFRLVKMQRLKYINSDHFPIFVKMELKPYMVKPFDHPEATADDRKLMEEKIQAGSH